MDYAAELNQLKQKEARLEDELAAAKTEPMQLAIRAQLKANQESQATFGAKIEVPDTSTFLERCWRPIHDDPLIVGSGFAVSCFMFSWLNMRRYTIMRHTFQPYPDSQLTWRNWVFFLDAKSVPNARRVAMGSAFLVVLRNWTKKPPPGGWK